MARLLNSVFLIDDVSDDLIAEIKSFKEMQNIFEEIQKQTDCSEVFTTLHFKELVKNGKFNSFDGDGYYHDGKNETDVSIWSRQEIDTSYPYVCWYNK